MGIQYTPDQIMAMAPDASSASAGKKLAVVKSWKDLGQSSSALWGECQGSALYQVKVDLSAFSIQCSCPSRKQPCKHGLGLLLLATTTPEAVPLAEPPEWMASWLSRRAAAAKRKEAPMQAKEGTTPSASRAKTADRRLVLVKAGIERLDLWLDDLIRNGLGAVETQPIKFWNTQAASMTDAQAPGLAQRIQRLSSLPNASPDWPEKLLTQLGLLTLLSQAFRNRDQLDERLQEDIKQLIGWNLKEEEVIARGEHVSDEWLILGQSFERQERVRVQSTWLQGLNTGRTAQILQYAFVGTEFAESYVPGTCQRAELVYWPGIQPQRALIKAREEKVGPIQAPLPGYPTIAAFFDVVASVLAALPWREYFLCTLNNIVPIYDTMTGQWWVRDQEGQGLQFAMGEYWQVLALSGGRPIDLAAEWNGASLLPLGFLAGEKYYPIRGNRV